MLRRNILKTLLIGTVATTNWPTKKFQSRLTERDKIIKAVREKVIECKRGGEQPYQVLLSPISWFIIYTNSNNSRENFDGLEAYMVTSLFKNFRKEKRLSHKPAVAYVACWRGKEIRDVRHHVQV